MNTCRRSLLLGALGAAFSTQSDDTLAQSKPSFEILFAEALLKAHELEAVRFLREQPDVLGSKSAAPRVKRPDRTVAPEAIRMVVMFEVSSQEQYTKKYQSPVWPGGESGATIGIGHDLGYMRKSWLTDDWGDYLEPNTLVKLEKACGVTGSDAKVLTPKLKDIVIPWQPAMAQFESKLLPLYIGATLQVLPLAANLSDKSLGALVSLVYNRGTSFSSPKDRHKEMRAIKTALAEGDYSAIPEQILRMRRLWDAKKFPGLHTRRKLEATLFQEGLT